MPVLRRAVQRLRPYRADEGAGRQFRDVQHEVQRSVDQTVRPAGSLHAHSVTENLVMPTTIEISASAFDEIMEKLGGVKDCAMLDLHGITVIREVVPGAAMDAHYFAAKKE